MIVEEDDEFHRLFHDPDYSLKDIAQHYQFTSRRAGDIIGEVAKDMGYKSKTAQYNDTLNKLKEQFFDLYIVENLTSDEIIRRFDITEHGFEKIRKELKVTKPKCKEQLNRERNNKQKYGVGNVSSIKEVDDKKHVDSKSRTIDQAKFASLYHKHGTNYTAKYFNISLDYVQKLRVKYNIDISHARLNTPEKEIREFLVQNNIKHLINDRKILEGKELDFVLPEHNIAIEYNGIFWHNDQIVSKNYHLEKSEMCKSKGIQLIHIFENEYINNRELIESMILAKCGIFERRLYARACTVKEISGDLYKSFVSTNHIQGYCASKIRIGLFYDNELVQCMSFSSARFSDCQYELIRLCAAQNTQIVGGASKLLKYFKRNYNPTSIVTYANKRYSMNSCYDSIGFSYSHTSNCNYFYFHTSHPLILYSRNKFQKHKLKNIDGFDFNPNESEYNNMKRNKYARIWDCGNDVFKWEGS